jgi:hypothetical protein
MTQDSDSETHPSPVLTVPHQSFWQKLGGGSLMIATLVHALLLLIGAFWVFHIIKVPDKAVDFMPPGGGGGERGAEHQVQQKKRAQITPVVNVKRVFAEGATASYAIPEQGENFGEMSTLSSLSGGGMSGGLGASGTGEGFGKGAGVGAGLGNGGNMGIKLFGMNLDAKSIAVVLDVSGSMTPHLKRVIKEVDEVAKGSPMILHVGCGIGEVRGTDRIKPVDAPSDGFEEFWRLHHDPAYRGAPQWDRHTRVNKKRPMPDASLYELIAPRPKTYYYEFNGVEFTGNAIASDKFKDVDAIYWFADFMDPISEKDAEKLKDTLIKRKQKLYIQATVNGQYLSIARDKIAIPTGGKQVFAPKL